MALLKPRNFRLRDDQHEFLDKLAAKNEEGNVSRLLRKIVDQVKAAPKKFGLSN